MSNSLFLTINIKYLLQTHLHQQGYEEQIYHIYTAFQAILPPSYLQVSHVRRHCKSKGLCNAPGMQLTNKEQRMMTQ